MFISTQPKKAAQKTKHNQFLIPILFIPLFLLLVVLLAVISQKAEFVTGIKTKLGLAKPMVLTQTQPSPTAEMIYSHPKQEPEFEKTSATLPKCGDVLKIVDAETNTPPTATASALKIEGTGFSATDCDRIEIRSRLIKEGKVIWQGIQVDPSCSTFLKENGTLKGDFPLTKPGNLPPLGGTTFEVCFDLINKAGGRISQNLVSDCPILTSRPHLCQEIPLPESWY